MNEVEQGVGGTRQTDSYPDKKLPSKSHALLGLK